MHEVPSPATAPPEAAPRAAWAPELACLLALGLACVRALAGLEGVVDLSMHDEAGYLWRGLALPARGMPDPEWGPLYSLWYLALSRLSPEPTTLYYLSYRVLTVAAVLGLYAAARRLSAPRWAALAAAVAFLVSGAPHVLPRPSLLALAVVLGALALGARARRTEGFLAALGLGALVAAGARPEAFLGFLLASAALALVLLRGALRDGAVGRGRALRWGAPYALAALAVVAVLGNPFGNTSGRRFYAFCQHFALTWTQRHPGSGLEPWGQCEAAVEAAFGPGVTSVGGALRAAPGELAAHVAHNARLLPRLAAEVGVLGLGGGGPHAGDWAQERAVRLGLLVALLLPLLGVLLRARALWRAGVPRPVQRAGLFAVLALAPAVPSVFLIHPREHYLVVPAAALWLLCAVLAHWPLSLWERDGVRDDARPSPVTAHLPWALTALVVALATPALLPPGAPRAHWPREQTHRAVVDALRGLVRAGELPAAGARVLDGRGGYAQYLGAQHRVAWPGNKRAPFFTYLRDARVDAVVLEPVLARDPRFVDDAEFHAFARDPGAFGFRVVPLPGGVRVVYLPRAPAPGPLVGEAAGPARVVPQ